MGANRWQCFNTKCAVRVVEGAMMRQHFGKVLCFGCGTEAQLRPFKESDGAPLVSDLQQPVIRHEVEDALIDEFEIDITEEEEEA